MSEVFKGQIHWSELRLGRPYNMRIHPLMFSEFGYTHTSERATTGGRHRVNKEYVTVLYDEDYVKKKITEEVIKPLLGGMRHPDFVKDFLCSLVDDEAPDNDYTQPTANPEE